ncbi:hypothetical protein [Aureimonas sp. SK2]|uniref:hypothetical protein n=1 Tax=Aureimonas sp. SK2 TaxID=3015992 RepID=UPI0024447AC6|nr:hypothetical protein [Aureimonas sp. SK2]
MRPSTLHSTALALLVSTASAALAQPGTSQEALALQKRMERYIGKAAFADRYVIITPNAEGYRVAMDLSPLMSHLTDSGVTLEVSPFDFQMSRRADGNWDVAGKYFERLRFVTPAGPDGEAIDLDMRLNDGGYGGVVADSTGTFLTSSGRVGSMDMRQEDPRSVTQSTIGTNEYDWQASDSGPGLVNATMVQTIASSREVVVMKLAPAEPADQPETGEAATAPFDFGPTTTTMGATEIKASMAGMRAAAIQDLWALAVERFESSADGGDTFRDELRTSLRALGPVWTDFSAGYAMKDLKVESSVGSATLARFEQTMSSDGLVRSGDHRMTLAIEGLTLNSELLPPAARDLMPRSAVFNFAATGVDLETPMRLVADHIDPKRETLLPQETGEALLASFLEHPPRLLVEPSRITGPGYEMTVDLAAEWSGDAYGLVANISATGIDGVLAKLQAAGTPEALQTAGVLGLAKGFGRPEVDGRTAWTIERPSDGSVKVNGVELVPAPAPTTTP